MHLRTKKYIENNKKGLLISINVLEFVSVIINYAAAITVLNQEKHTDDPFPVLLDMADNTACIRWTNHACKDSLAGRALGRFLCMLLVNTNLGINAKWLSTDENLIADTISRLQDSPDKAKKFFDYSKLKQQFPQLAPCRAFLPSPELRSLIWDCVLHAKSPNPQQVKEMIRDGLGKLTS